MKFEKMSDRVGPITYDQFLERLELTHSEYIFALRSDLRMTKVFLKRESNAVHVNAYNRDILELWKANMDIQFILDPYACLAYIINYINKSDRGLSKLLRDINGNIKEDETLFQRLKKITSAFVNASEISAQEVVYQLLGKTMSSCSRDTIYVSSVPKEDRVRMVKSKKTLEFLAKKNKNSTDIFVDGVIEHYINRPKQLKDVSLAEFATWYNFGRKNTKKNYDSDDQPDDTDGNSEGENSDDLSNEVLSTGKNGVFIRRRTKAKILRFRRIQFHVDPLGFYREQLMLFLPWHDEKKDLDEIINHPS